MHAFCQACIHTQNATIGLPACSEGGAAALRDALGLHVAHPGLSCLRSSAALRSTLGCAEMSAGTLLELAKVCWGGACVCVSGGGGRGL